MMKTWVPIPTKWITDHGLKDFQWSSGGKGSDEQAALMIYIMLAHHSDALGMARLTYTKINHISGLSRAKVSVGIDILLGRNLIAKENEQSVFRIQSLNMNVRGWGMLPAAKLYTVTGRLTFFKSLKLRSRAELNALKILLLFTERRDSTANIIHLSYDKINEYTGIHRSHIQDALSLLCVNGLIRVDQQRSEINQFAVSNSYRLAHIDSFKHRGTTGRAQMSEVSYD